MTIYEELQAYRARGAMTPEAGEALQQFLREYEKAVASLPNAFQQVEPYFRLYLATLVEKVAHPFEFGVFHRGIDSPHDFYAMGVELFRPLIDLTQSRILGLPYLQEIASLVERGENVILLSNHQTEADPQVISLLLENHFPRLAREMIFVAGHRVTSDPLAVPFSMGRNLLCIYSKRHMDHPPEQKGFKQAHNAKAMRKMGELLEEGGKVFWIAPSGGRDRPGPEGCPVIAPFDPSSVELLFLKARQSPIPTHLYPLSIGCFSLLPPPDTLKKELGEKRDPHRTSTALAFGPRLEEAPSSQVPTDKQTLRQIRTEWVFRQVKDNYEAISRGLTC